MDEPSASSPFFFFSFSLLSLPLLSSLCVDFQLIRLRRIKNTPSHRYQISAFFGRWWMAVAKKIDWDSNFTRLLLACYLVSQFCTKRVSQSNSIETLTSSRTNSIETTGKNVLPAVQVHFPNISSNFPKNHKTQLEPPPWHDENPS